MVLDVRRPLRERAKLFVFAWVFVTIATFVLFARSGSWNLGPAAEGVIFLSVVVGLVGAFLVDAMVSRAVQAFRVARLGDTRERAALIAKTPHASGGDAAAIALVALEQGSIHDAALLISRFPPLASQRTTVEELARLRYRLALEALDGRKKLVDEILDWRASTFGAHALELERYAAFVVVSHVDADLSDRTTSIARRLLTHRDEQVRGYGSWLALELDDLPSRERAAKDFAMGTALAGHHGRAELAGLLAARASKLAAGAGTTAYRS